MASEQLGLTKENVLKDSAIDGTEIKSIHNKIDTASELVKKDIDNEIKTQIVDMVSGFEKGILENGEIKTNLEKEDLKNFADVVSYVYTLVLSDKKLSKEEGIKKSLLNLQNSLYHQRLKIDSEFAEQSTNRFAPSTEDKQKQEQEQKSTHILEIRNQISDGISFMELDTIKSAIEDGTYKIEISDDLNPIMDNLIRGMELEDNLGSEKINAYKTFIDRLPIPDKMLPTSKNKCYDHFCKKEYDLLSKDLNIDYATSQNLYAQYVGSTTTKEILESNSPSKIQKIKDLYAKDIVAKNKESVEKSDKMNLNNYLSTTTTLFPNNMLNQTPYDKDFADLLKNTSMKDIFDNYSISQKSDLAYSLVAMKPLTTTEGTIKLNCGLTLKQIDDVMNAGYTVVDKLTRFPNNPTKKIDTWIISKTDQMTITGVEITKDAFKEYQEKMKSLRHDEFLKTYASFYRKGADIPPATPVYTKASGDMSSTNGRGGYYNNSRRTFEYDLNSPNKQTNSLEFGLKKNEPMTLTLSAFGLDERNKQGGMDVVISFSGKDNDRFDITGKYSKNAQGDPELVFTNPKDDILVKNNGLVNTSLTIPPQYSGYDMKITQTSGSYATGYYDECTLQTSLDNGILSDGTAANNERGTIDTQKTEFAGGSSDIPKKDQMDMSKTIKQICYFSERSVSSGIEMNVNAGVNDAELDLSKIDNKSKEPEYIVGRKSKIQTLEKNISTNVSLTTAWKEYQTYVQSATSEELGFPASWNSSPKQIEGQKLLAQSRFLEVLNFIQNDTNMMKLINSGKIKIVPSYLHNSKESSITVDPIEFTAKAK